MAFQHNSKREVETHSKPKLVKKRKTILEVPELDSESETEEVSFQNLQKEENSDSDTLQILKDLATESFHVDSSSNKNSFKAPTESQDSNLGPSQKNWSVVSRLSTCPTATWNEHSNIVYYAFKVTPYVVRPNNLLCATTRPNASQFPTIESFLQIAGSRSNLPSWSDIEEDLLKVLIIYKGCEDLSSVLRRAGDAVELIRTTIQFCLPSIPTVVPERSPAFNEFVSYMEEFCTTFIRDLNKHRLKKELFSRYLQRLISFFSLTTKLPIEIMQKHSLSLDLTTSNKSEGAVMAVEPEFQLRLMNRIFLVGEVKNFSMAMKEDKNAKGQKVKDSSQTRGSEPQPSASAECGSHWMPGESVCEADRSEPTGSDGPPYPDNQETSQSSGSEKYFRKLKDQEANKTCRFLPQLLAQMLAAMNTNVRNGRQPRNGLINECVQMGFFMEAFKLRFIRLVLRQVNIDKVPTLEDIRSPNVRCDVFITQEINLFRPSHIKLFFQILFGIARASYRP